jgi:tetratricopeptide (TPR) repeat protein
MRCLVLAVLMLLLGAVSGVSGQRNSEPKANPETLQLMQQGSAFYLQHDFKRAIPPYQRALDLEKQNRTLNQTLWRVLIDNLGMSYGVSGNLKKAKETFEYGLSKDPKYPMFHYNMACTYAEMNDPDKAIDYLKQAFAYKENMIKGERMPDPWTDSSFERFMNNDKFVQALRDLTRD